MPAGFNKGQIEYIKTIANVNGHKTYKNVTVASQDHTALTGTQCVADDHARYLIWNLGDSPLTYPAGSVDGTTNVAADGTMQSIDCYNVPIQADQATANESNRVTPECFLESVNLKMRHIIDLDNTIDAQSHKEFRLIVFRHREKQHASAQLAENFSNPLFDMFFGASATKYGPKGVRKKMDDEGTIDYVAHSGAYVASFDRDRMMTDSINTEDYVVMKDCRYYLGREYGGKHIYEDRFHWDHEDPIATDDNDISYNDNQKNYCWYIFLLGINNAGSTAIDNLGYVNLFSNTHVTSG